MQNALSVPNLGSLSNNCENYQHEGPGKSEVDQVDSKPDLITLILLVLMGFDKSLGFTPEI